MQSKVSIIMPVLNGERYLTEALESILAQTYGNYELVAVDDGSTDSTAELLHRYADRLELRYVHHPARMGIAASVNDGLRHASGDFITFLDHDDAWFPHFLQTQASYLDRHPEVGMVHSDFQTIDSAGAVIEESVARCRGRKRPSGHVLPQLLMDSFIVANSVLIRKECFNRLGGFDETLRWGDYHMWLRIAHHYKIDYVPEVLTKYRQHAVQSTRDFEERYSDEEPATVAAIRKLLEAYPEIRRQISDQMLRRRVAGVYFGTGYYWLWKGAHRLARPYVKKAIRLEPTCLRYYFTYALSLLPAHSVPGVQRMWRRAQKLFRGSAFQQHDPRLETADERVHKS
jgi:glycosyltransferase involved in cell wall biosynthesis